MIKDDLAEDIRETLEKILFEVYASNREYNTEFVIALLLANSLRFAKKYGYEAEAIYSMVQNHLPMKFDKEFKNNEL